MKFQKGLLSDLVPKGPEVKKGPSPQRPRSTTGRPTPSRMSDQDHLFETLEEETSSERNYLKLLAVVVVGVIAVGLVVFYFTLPGVGDAVRVSAELELAVRDHFLTTQKRTATDVVFYQCDGFYDARVGVETRTDLPNPLFRVGTYSSRIVPSGGGSWDIRAVPLTAPTEFVPCQ